MTKHRLPSTLPTVLSCATAAIGLVACGAPLTAALAMNEPTFADDTAWFLAVAEQRAGRASDAVRRLDELCKASGPRSNNACASLQTLSYSR